MNLAFYGQVSFLFKIWDIKFLIDPYFSNSVEEKEDSSIKRLVPIPLNPSDLTDIDFVLITHSHRDHCDPDTLLPLAQASPSCQFYGPAPAINMLTQAGIKPNRLHLIKQAGFDLLGIRIQPVPSAHPQINAIQRGGWQANGYVFEADDKRYYHPGDTAVSAEIITAVKSCGNIDIGMIPVNEINYYRNQDGIIGNMSIREAFQFAEDIGIKTFIPTHWDMFAKNQVYKEEIQLLYDKIKPNFDLIILEAGNSYAS